MKNRRMILIIIIGIVILGALGWYLYYKISKFPISASQIQTTQKNQPFTSAKTAPKTCEKIEISNTPILMYHHLKLNTDPNNKLENGLDVNPENFKNQLNYLKSQNYQAIHLDDLFCKTAIKNVVITFDDGYDDVINNAFPILKSFKYTATLLVITNKVGTPGYLTWDNIKTLKNAGWEIGSHTLNHLDLSTLNSINSQKEISESKKTIEDKIGSGIDLFCYPSGKYNSSTISLVKKANYKYAVTAHEGKVNELKNPFELKRIRVDGQETLSGFIKKL